MAEQKTNRRVQYTRSALREALIGLISEKPLFWKGGGRYVALPFAP